jgi:hypothetical protein
MHSDDGLIGFGGFVVAVCGLRLCVVQHCYSARTARTLLGVAEQKMMKGSIIPFCFHWRVDLRKPIGKSVYLGRGLYFGVTIFSLATLRRQHSSTGLSFRW